MGYPEPVRLRPEHLLVRRIGVLRRHQLVHHRVHCGHDGDGGGHGPRGHLSLAVPEVGQGGPLPHCAAAGVLHGHGSRAVHVHRQHHRHSVSGRRHGGVGPHPALRPGSHDPGGDLLCQSGRQCHHVRRSPQHHHRYLAGSDLLRFPHQHRRCHADLSGGHGGVLLLLLPPHPAGERESAPHGYHLPIQTPPPPSRIGGPSSPAAPCSCWWWCCWSPTHRRR